MENKLQKKWNNAWDTIDEGFKVIGGFLAMIFLWGFFVIATLLLLRAFIRFLFS